MLQACEIIGRGQLIGGGAFKPTAPLHTGVEYGRLLNAYFPERITESEFDYVAVKICKNAAALMKTFLKT